MGDRLRAVYLIADEPATAALAALDLREWGVADIRLVEGGFSAWRAADLPMETTPREPPDDEMIDFLWFVHDRHDGNLDSSCRYLAWEQGLVRQLDSDERPEFRLPI